MSQQTLQLVIPLAIVAVFFLLRARRMGKPQPLRLGMLWVRPAYLLFACAVVLLLPSRPGMTPVPLMPTDWAILGLGALLGAIGGWHYGRTVAIEVHPENGTLMMRSTPVGLMVLLLLVVLRFGVRDQIGVIAAGWPVQPAVIIDALIVFTAALFTVRSLEMYLRAKKVLAAAG